MTDLTAIGGHQLASLDDLPQRRAGERLEDLARELMMVTAMLCSAELRNGLCEAETVERAKRALQAGASARTGLRTRGAEPVKTRSKLHHLPLEGRKNVYCRRAFSRTRPLTSVRKKSPAIRSGAGYRVKRPRQPTTQPRSIEKFARDHDRNATL
jgi:hypothetical protein